MRNIVGLKYTCYTIYFLFVLFGPKILGAIDLQVLFSFLCICFVLKNKQIKTSRYLFLLIKILFIIFLYSLIVTVFQNQSDFYFVSRSARALLTFAFITTFIYQITKRGLITFLIFKNSLLVALSFNAVSILIQGFIPSTQDYFAYFTLYDKSVYPFKGFGLTAGFDAAGLISVYAALLSLFFYFNNKRPIYFFIAFVNISATFFTSRTPIVFLFLSIVFSIVILPKFGIKTSSLFLPVLFLSILVLYILLPLILSKINIELSPGFLYNLSTASVLSPEYLSAFAFYQDPISSVTDEFSIPNSFEFIFGTAGPSFGDPGYIHVFWLGGFIYFVLTILFYFESKKVFFSINKYMLLNKLSIYEFQEIKMMGYLFFLMMVVFNFKHFFFFTRGFHDLLPILLGFIYGYSKFRSNQGVGLG